jgi:hypothetical protein
LHMGVSLRAEMDASAKFSMVWNFAKNFFHSMEISTRVFSIEWKFGRTSAGQKLTGSEEARSMDQLFLRIRFAQRRQR